MKNVTILNLVLFLILTACKNDKQRDKVNNSNKEKAKKEAQFDSKKYIEYKEIDTLILESSFKSQDSFEVFSQRFKTVNIDDAVYYVVEGDLLYDIDQLYFYYENLRNTNNQSQGNGDKLLGITKNGNIIRIQNSNDIKYAVIKSSFESEENYLKIVEYMSKATADWSAACNVSFTHKNQLDLQLNPSENPEELDFVVREYETNGAFIAKAFFPYYPKYRKKILIDPSFYSMRFNPSGVLRHELGHTLGFLHEHIRSGAPAKCPNENLSEALELTDYDPKSVMHYFCGGVGTKELELSENDKIGAQLLYGEPNNIL